MARDDAMSVPRRLLLLFTCMAVGSAASFAPAEPSETAQRPNILWLIAEDMGVELGCYGASEVETPHLDALARSGVRYTRFYT
ncbi:MAG: sulfatase-like hydrolase/transferase, partial [Pirellulales bacterium]|nr:sulfatase-like hydrolase/transferase [Pirellulales bacterium]